MGKKGYANAPQYYVYKRVTCLVYKVKSAVLCAYDCLSVCLSVPLPVYYQVSAPQPVDRCHVHQIMSSNSDFKPNRIVIKMTSAQPLYFTNEFPRHKHTSIQLDHILHSCYRAAS